MLISTLLPSLWPNENFPYYLEDTIIFNMNGQLNGSDISDFKYNVSKLQVDASYRKVSLP